VLDRYRPSDTSVLDVNYTHWVKKWIEWGLHSPPNEGISNHPLKKFNGKISCSYSKLPEHNVVFLGGFWDTDKQNVTESSIDREITDIPANTPILICAVCSVISPQEHPRQFTHSSSEELISSELIDSKTREVIDKSTASVQISMTNGNNNNIDLTRVDSNLKNDNKSSSSSKDKITYYSNILDHDLELDRVFIPTDNYDVDEGIWKCFTGKKTIRASVDGYWLFLKGLERGDQYTININADSPFFDSDNPKDNPRFDVNVNYRLKVV